MLSAPFKLLYVALFRSRFGAQVGRGERPGWLRRCHAAALRGGERPCIRGASPVEMAGGCGEGQKRRWHGAAERLTIVGLLIGVYMLFRVDELR